MNSSQRGDRGPDARGSRGASHKLIGHSATQPKRSGASNEDAFVVDDALGLYVVADGMGGYEFGSEASRLVVNTIESVVAEKSAAMSDASDWKGLLRDAVSQANIALCKLAAERKAPMGSTVTAALFRADQVHVAHVGDCRLYLFDSTLAPKQLTLDHRVAGSGGNRLERSMGKGLNVGCDLTSVDLPKTGYALLLCCDGIWGALPVQALAALIREHTASDVAQEVVVQASAKQASGEEDDATVVYVESPEMTELKEKQEIDAVEQEVRTGKASQDRIERVLQYNAAIHNNDKLRELFVAFYLPIIESGRTASERILNQVLDILRENYHADYQRILLRLEKKQKLPVAKAADLASMMAQQEDVTDEALRVYEKALAQKPAAVDPIVRAMYGLCLLNRHEDAKAEEQLVAAFINNPDIRKRIHDRLVMDFGVEGHFLAAHFAVRSKSENVVGDLDQLLRNSSLDQRFRGQIEGLLRVVARDYPSGSRDRVSAAVLVQQIEEGRESALLKRELTNLQEQMSVMRQRLEQEQHSRQSAEERCRDLGAELTNKERSFAQARGEMESQIAQMQEKMRDLQRSRGPEYSGTRFDRVSLTEAFDKLQWPSVAALVIMGIGTWCLGGSQGILSTRVGILGLAVLLAPWFARLLFAISDARMHLYIWIAVAVSVCALAFNWFEARVGVPKKGNDGTGAGVSGGTSAMSAAAGAADADKRRVPNAGTGQVATAAGSSGQPAVNTQRSTPTNAPTAQAGGKESRGNERP